MFELIKFLGNLFRSENVNESVKNAQSVSELAVKTIDYFVKNGLK